MPFQTVGETPYPDFLEDRRKRTAQVIRAGFDTIVQHSKTLMEAVNLLSSPIGTEKRFERMTIDRLKRLGCQHHSLKVITPFGIIYGLRKPICLKRHRAGLFSI